MELKQESKRLNLKPIDLLQELVKIDYQQLCSLIDSFLKDDGRVILWDLRNLEANTEFYFLSYLGDSFPCLSYSNVQDRLVVGGGLDKSIQIYDRITQSTLPKQRMKLLRHSAAVHSLKVKIIISNSNILLT